MIGNLPGQLRDIREIDPVSFWPPAPGWWLVAGGLLLVIALTVLITRALIKNPIGGWKRDARRQLLDLRRYLRSQPPKKVGNDLSELLRRIAIARFGRERVAGLAGEEWLEFISDHDPAGFAWRAKGQLLLQLPYAPAGTADDALQLSNLINAALKMVSASTEDYYRQRKLRIPDSVKRRLTWKSRKEAAGV